VRISLTDCPHDFQNAIEEKSKQKLDGCIACGTCTAGCPNITLFDYSPRELILLIKRGEKKKVLESKAVWLCVGCYQCEERCPSKISMAHVMDTLREMCVEEGYRVGDQRVLLFHHKFLENMARFGRAAEAMLALQYNIVTKDYFRDLDLGRKMFLKGKMPLFPHKIRNVQQVRKFVQESGINGGAGEWK